MSFKICRISSNRSGHWNLLSFMADSVATEDFARLVWCSNSGILERTGCASRMSSYALASCRVVGEHARSMTSMAFHKFAFVRMI